MKKHFQPKLSEVDATPIPETAEALITYFTDNKEQVRSLLAFSSKYRERFLEAVENALPLGKMFIMSHDSKAMFSITKVPFGAEAVVYYRFYPIINDEGAKLHVNETIKVGTSAYFKNAALAWLAAIDELMGDIEIRFIDRDEWKAMKHNDPTTAEV